MLMKQRVTRSAGSFCNFSITKASGKLTRLKIIVNRGMQVVESAEAAAGEAVINSSTLYKELAADLLGDSGSNKIQVQFHLVAPLGLILVHLNCNQVVLDKCDSYRFI